jgi:alkanesulfonate monooxygenase SsuD/methylene tetrahydromethanopterin reductase-like flavin-dependent oxidoreductase (luciferase family)
MQIGHFTEQPYQDDKIGLYGTNNTTLDISNALYDREIGARLYDRFIEEKAYAEAVGFDELMFNEHHSTPFNMQSSMNMVAAAVARATSKAKILLIGNLLPLWDDPVWLAEELGILDQLSHGRLVAGIVRGGGTESTSHNTNPTHNWERFVECHDLILKTWTTPGPFRWEGKHYQFRYVNPWTVPYQKPHPPIVVAGVVTKESCVWAAQHRYPYYMLSLGKLDFSKGMFNLYHEAAKESGYTSGPQNIGFMIKTHLEETDERAEEVGKKFMPPRPASLGGGSTIATTKPWIQSLPGLNSRESQQVRLGVLGAVAASGVDSRGISFRAPYEEQLKSMQIITGTPKSVLPRMRQILELLRPGSLILWDGDGSMTHDDAVRSMRLMGNELIPALKEMGKELGLNGYHEVDPATGKRKA